HSVAVMGFRDASERPTAAWISVAFADLLEGELGASENLRTVGGEWVARMKRDLALRESEAYDRDALSRIRAHLGVDFVVTGSYQLVGSDEEGKLRIEVAVQETRSGATVLTTIFTAIDAAVEAEVSDIVIRAGASLREQLVGSQDAAAEAKAAQ